MSIELQHSDIVRLILQFLKESNLLSSYQTLQSESLISLNLLDSPSDFNKDVINGKWDSVLKQITMLSLPSSKLMLLYEQLVYELLELSEKEAVLKILTETLINNGLRQQFPERCLTLDYLAKRSCFDAKNTYKQGSKEKNRLYLASQLAEEIKTAQSSRLLVLLGQAMKYQESQGLVQTGQVFDVFGNRKVKNSVEEAKLPLCVDRTIKLGGESRVESLCFSDSGEFLAVGCKDGIIEVWEPMTGKLKKDLAYQSEELFMLHNDPVISLAFSKDGELLASGDNKGIAKLWRVRNGKNLRKIDDNFGKPITFIGFGRDVSHLIIAEKSIRFFGLKSGRIIKEFVGHTSSVNDVLFCTDGTRLASGSNDARLRIWDYASCEVLKIMTLNTELSGMEYPVLSLQEIKNLEQFVVFNRSNSIYMVDWEGKVVKRFVCERKETEFRGGTLSLQRKEGCEWIFGMGNDGCLYCFNVKSGKIDHALRVREERMEIVGVRHHPSENLVVVASEEGEVLFLTP